MIGKANKREASQLSAAIDRVIDEMEQYGPGAPEYEVAMSYLERLNALKAPTRPKGFSPDQILLVAGNLLGILAIVAYEQHHVMTSKAQNFIMKPQ